MLVLKVFKQLHRRTGRKKDGSEFTYEFQEAEILRENRRPQVVQISISNNGKYDDGLYTLSADSFRPNMYERLEMKFPELISLEDALTTAQKVGKVPRALK